MEDKLLLLVNPVSGNGSAKLWMYDMIDVLSKRFPKIAVHISRSAGDIESTAAKYAADFDALVCTGGDGSMSELISGVVKSGASPLLGYLPLGTVNDFATSHGISKNVKVALEVIVSGKENVFDSCVLGDRAFSYVAAFGAFTDVPYTTPQNTKSSFGILAYLTEAAKRLPKIKPINLTYTVANEVRTGEFIYGMVSNTKSVAGINFFGATGNELLCDGKAEVILVRFPKTPEELIGAIHSLLDPKATVDGVIRLCVPEIKFHFDDGEVAWTVDGEYGGSFHEVGAKILRNRIRMLL